MAQEYYVRQPDSETARGPFNIDKLLSLVEAEQVTRDTLYYDEAKESWVRVGGNEELCRQLFPEKKKLALRPRGRDELNLLNNPEEISSKVDVQEILAAAEGDTADTRHFKRRESMRMRAAALSIPLIGTLLVLSALSYIIPSFATLNQAFIDKDPFILLRQPLLVVGLTDLFFAICVYLSAVEIYPLVRFRAALGMGFFALTYWSRYENIGNPEDLMAAYCVVAGSFGVFASTMTLNLLLLILFGLIGLAGMGGFAWYAFLHQFIGA